MPDDATPVGRFAPSPTGRLHLGSLVAAMASFLDARARRGRWLVRIEDIDGPRVVPGSADDILRGLVAFGFRWDGPVMFQSDRDDAYARAFERLRAEGHVYPCGCTRKEVEEASAAHAVYPGTCRAGLPPGRGPRAWRMRVPDAEVAFVDRAFGTVRQHLGREVGDFVVKRADGLWAYQLAVVVDDADQGITDVVRGSDLLDSTPRQRWLQQVLGLPMPRTLHVPLVLDGHGEKLAKQNDAAPIDADRPLPALDAAARHLGLPLDAADSVEAFWSAAVPAWAARWPDVA